MENCEGGSGGGGSGGEGGSEGGVGEGASGGGGAPWRWVHLQISTYHRITAFFMH